MADGQVPLRELRIAVKKFIRDLRQVNRSYLGVKAAMKKCHDAGIPSQQAAKVVESVAKDKTDTALLEKWWPGDRD